MVAVYLKAGGCLTIALEIASDQQAVLDAGVRGEKPLSDISIHPIIDHPAYRRMIERFRDLVQAGRRLKVRAVDSPKDDPRPRDAWMAEEVQKLVSSGPVLALVGSLHALKRIRWESGKDKPYLAEWLVRRGVSVLAVLQEWEPNCEERVGRLLDVRHPRAVAAVHSTVGVAKAYPPETPEEATDYVVV